MRIKKTSQTTPIQAQVVNTKSNSTTDSYSCDYNNNYFAPKGTVLYENASGSNGNVTVSDHLYNYDYVDIIYGKTSKKSIYVARIVVPPNISDYNFSLNRTGGLTGDLILEYTDYSYSNKVITPTSYYEVEIKNGAYNTLTSYNGNYIFKVIGY